jgi:hypothetical protein
MSLLLEADAPGNAVLTYLIVPVEDLRLIEGQALACRGCHHARTTSSGAQALIDRLGLQQDVSATAPVALCKYRIRAGPGCRLVSATASQAG